MKERGESALEKADKVVHEYSWQNTVNAFKDIQESLDGKGCNCNTCLQSKVSEANSWLDFMEGSGEGDMRPTPMRFEVKDGKIESISRSGGVNIYNSQTPRRPRPRE